METGIGVLGRMKKDKKKNFFEIAAQNLRAKKFRTIFMMFFVMLMSVTFFFSTLLVKNLELGIKNTTERMGADMIVVPKEGTEDIRDSLFSGTPCSIFFNREEEEIVREMEGVKKASPQLYLATLSASCCDAAVQLIAFDPQTDFVVSPWLESREELSLKTGEVVVGDKVIAEVGEKIKFFDTQFTVAERLERTGMGYDNSVFMTYDTAALLKNSEIARKVLPVEEMDGLASMVMVDVDDDMVKKEVASLQIAIQKIQQDGMKMRAFTADDLMSGIASQVRRLSGYGNLLTYIMVISTALALISIFVITINERKYEFGILYTLGAKKSFITNIILSEAFIISAAGGIAGIILAAYGIVTFQETISIKLNIPYFDCSLKQMMPVAAVCILIALLTGMIAAACSSYRISKDEAYRLIRESE